MSIFKEISWKKYATIGGGLILSTGLLSFLVLNPSNNGEVIQDITSSPSTSQDGGLDARLPNSPQNNPSIWRGHVVEWPQETGEDQAEVAGNDQDQVEGVGITICANSTIWTIGTSGYDGFAGMQVEKKVWLGIGTPPEELSIAFVDRNGDGLLQRSEAQQSNHRVYADQQRNLLAVEGSDVWLFSSETYEMDWKGSISVGDLITPMIQSRDDWTLDLRKLDKGC